MSLKKILDEISTVSDYKKFNYSFLLYFKDIKIALYLSYLFNRQKEDQAEWAKCSEEEVKTFLSLSTKEQLRVQNKLRTSGFLRDRIDSVPPHDILIKIDWERLLYTIKEPTVDTRLVSVKKKEKKVNSRVVYSSEFNVVYAAYPRQEDKLQAYKAYIKRLKNGYNHLDLAKASSIEAAKWKLRSNDLSYCKKLSTVFSDKTDLDDLLSFDPNSVKIFQKDPEQIKIDAMNKRRQSTTSPFSNPTAQIENSGIPSKLAAFCSGAEQ